MTRCLATERQFTGYGRPFVLLLVIGALALAAGPVSATSTVRRASLENSGEVCLEERDRPFPG